MPLTITIEHDGYEKGAELDVGGLLLVNGEATEVSDEAASFFKAKHGKSINDHFSGQDHVKITGAANENYDAREAERKADELAAYNEKLQPSTAVSETTTPPKGSEEEGVNS